MTSWNPTRMDHSLSVKSWIYIVLPGKSYYFCPVMKKVSITILAFLYLAVSSGIALNIHHCMGKIYSVGLFGHSDKCGKCGMKSGHGLCCSDQFKMVKLNDSHLASSGEIPINSPVVFVNQFQIQPLIISYNKMVPDRIDHSPPGPSGKLLCVYNCVFRI